MKKTYLQRNFARCTNTPPTYGLLIHTRKVYPNRWTGMMSSAKCLQSGKQTLHFQLFIRIRHVRSRRCDVCVCVWNGFVVAISRNIVFELNARARAYMFHICYHLTNSVVLQMKMHEQNANVLGHHGPFIIICRCFLKISHNLCHILILLTASHWIYFFLFCVISFRKIYNFYIWF